MTTLTVSAPAPAVTWARPDTGLWVASTTERYLGMVEERRTGFLASDDAGRVIGTFSRIADAQFAVAPNLDEASGRDLEAALLKTAVVAGTIASALAAFGLWIYFV
jgi:hypothetical protein